LPYGAFEADFPDAAEAAPFCKSPAPASRQKRFDHVAVTPDKSASKVFTVGEPFALRFYPDSRCHMSQAQHYKFQADQAKRLARQVTDSEVRKRLLEMAGEYSRYAELMEARERPPE
jgi:hypothetical protein